MMKKEPVEGDLPDEDDVTEALAEANGTKLVEGEAEEGESIAQEGSDRGYLYEELLHRVFNMLRENNPEVAGERRMTVMGRPPQLVPGIVTVLVNFMDLVENLGSDAEHVMAFLLSELGTSRWVDGQERLMVEGQFAPRIFEGIVQRFLEPVLV